MARRTRVSEPSVSNGVVCRSTFTCNESTSHFTFHMINHFAPRSTDVASNPSLLVHLRTMVC